MINISKRLRCLISEDNDSKSAVSDCCTKVRGEVLMSKKLFLCLNFCLLLLLFGCSSEQGQSKAKTKETGQVILTISAASSLTDVLTETAEKFKEENPNIALQFNFGASGALKQQISLNNSSYRDFRKTF